MKKRLDVEMLARGIARSRSAAADLIKRGKVTVNGAVITKTSYETALAEAISIAEGTAFASRAGEKLAHALRAFDVDPKGLVALDIGSSTGGFVDCLLQGGAAKVVAVDVGKDQLAAALRTDPRIELHEGTDIRDFPARREVDAPAAPFADLVVVDVSFISLELVLPKAFALLKPRGRTIALVKPQFEVGKEIADRFKGIITDEGERQRALEKIKALAKRIGFSIIGETASPIEGEKGNREFLLLLRK